MMQDREFRDALLNRVATFADTHGLGVLPPNIAGPPALPYLDVDFLLPEARRPFHDEKHFRTIILQVAVVWETGVGEDAALEVVSELLAMFPVNSYVAKLKVYKHNIVSGYDDDNRWRIPVEIHLRLIA